MNNTHRGIATPALIIVVALTMLLAGSYSYSKLYKKEKESDELVKSARLSLERSSRPIAEIAAELELAKSKLQTEIDRLQIFRESGFNPASSYGLALLTIEKELSDSVISRTDDIYKLVNNSSIDIAVKTKLTQERQELLSLINEWKKVLETAGSSQQNVGMAASAVIEAAQQYASTLEQAVQNLTPQNSNLTDTQIAAQEQVVEQVTNTVNQANNQINNIQPNPEVVNNLENNVEELEEELNTATENSNNNQNNNNNQNSSNNNNNLNDINSNPPFIPPPVIDTSGLPQLIQGENTN